MTRHETLSYLAALIDHSSNWRIECDKVHCTISTRSRNQVLLLQRTFGGEIVERIKRYSIRYYWKGLESILVTLCGYLRNQTANLTKLPLYKTHRPIVITSVEPDTRFYTAGLMDANEAFSVYSGKVSVDCPAKTPIERGQLASWGFSLKERSISLRGKDNVRGLLQALQPFSLEHDKHLSILDGTWKGDLDRSVFSVKDTIYHVTTQAQKRSARLAAREAAIQAERERVIAKETDKMASKAARAERLRVAREKRDERALYLAMDQERIREQSTLKELDRLSGFTLARNAAASWPTKECCICRKELSREAFNRNVRLHDGLHADCKTCAHETYVKPHRAKLNERVKQWGRDNPDRIRAIRKRESAKPHNRVRSTLRGRLNKLVKRKSERTSELIGCTPRELIAKLEAQFLPGMDWSNWGPVWQIDHEIPCRAFDLTVKEERFKCFHHSNLRPLWSGENAKKQDRMPDGRLARHVHRRQALD